MNKPDTTALEFAKQVGIQLNPVQSLLLSDPSSAVLCALPRNTGKSFLIAMKIVSIASRLTKEKYSGPIPSFGITTHNKMAASRIIHEVARVAQLSEDLSCPVRVFDGNYRIHFNSRAGSVFAFWNSHQTVTGPWPSFSFVDNVEMLSPHVRTKVEFDLLHLSHGSRTRSFFITGEAGHSDCFFSKMSSLYNVYSYTEQEVGLDLPSRRLGTYGFHENRERNKCTNGHTI